MYKAKGKQETPATKIVWTELHFYTAPQHGIQTYTKDHDPYGILEMWNSPDYNYKFDYFLSDNGNTLTIRTDANKDGDFEDYENTPADGKAVYKRVK